MTWLTLTAHFASAPEDWSPFIEIFRVHGCENTIQTDSPPSLGAAIVEVPGSAELVEAIRRDLLAAGTIRVDCEPLVEQNWDEIWRMHFKPRRVGEHFVIRPTWEEFAARPDDLEIVLDPGQAFGTGDHPTTRMCLELLEQAVVDGISLADVGCGSGILSIAAKKLGATSVRGLDIEPISVEVAKENAALNAVDCKFLVGDSILDLQDGPYDLILSNIISATLIIMAGDFADSLRQGGEWIASGIIEQNWNDVTTAAERAGFKLIEARREDGWVAGRFEKNQ